MLQVNSREIDRKYDSLFEKQFACFLGALRTSRYSMLVKIGFDDRIAGRFNGSTVRNIAGGFTARASFKNIIFREPHPSATSY